jgi:phospholipase C
MPPGLDALKHIVVLMMENRSFDHMLGSLRALVESMMPALSSI